MSIKAINKVHYRYYWFVSFDNCEPVEHARTKVHHFQLESTEIETKAETKNAKTIISGQNLDHCVEFKL